MPDEGLTIQEIAILLRRPNFVRFANALSALYLKSSGEKRLVDATLLAVPR